MEMHRADPLVLEPSLSELKLLLRSGKGTDCQVLIKFWQNRFKQEMKCYVLRSVISLILSGIWKNGLSSRSLLTLYFTTPRTVFVHMPELTNYVSTIEISQHALVVEVTVQQPSVDRSG
jgi:hypothetical protein